jgi:hypothetical protein
MTRHAFLALALTLAACGGSTSRLNTSEIQAFDTSAQGVSATVTTYGTQAAAMTSPATCTSAQTSYDSQVRPMVGQMQGMGADMDGMMGSMNHMDAGDMGCSANAMLAEIDRHRAVACASTSDMIPSRAEAQQHVAAMTQWAGHAMGRSRDLAGMAGMNMGTMMGSGSTSNHCIHDADGSYTFQPWMHIGFPLHWSVVPHLAPPRPVRLRMMAPLRMTRAARSAGSLVAGRPTARGREGRDRARRGKGGFSTRPAVRAPRAAA